MSSTLGKAMRVLLIAVIGILMLPAGLGLLGCTMCAASGGMGSDSRLSFAIGAVVCLGILVGGGFALAKLSRQI